MSTVHRVPSLVSSNTRGPSPHQQASKIFDNKEKSEIAARERNQAPVSQASPMADTTEEEQEQEQRNCCPTLIIRWMSKRRTWVCLFVFVYTILLSSSWKTLKSVLSWYEARSAAAVAPSSTGWPALYASVLLGGVFGVLSMASALVVAVPATLVTWITVLVLLTFCGKPRRTLVVEGKKLTAEIARLVFKILIKEGNVVAAVCVILGYFFLVRKGREEVASSS